MRNSEREREREREREGGREVTLSKVCLEDHGGGLVDGAEDKALQQPKTKEVAGAS